MYQRPNHATAAVTRFSRRSAGPVSKVLGDIASTGRNSRVIRVARVNWLSDSPLQVTIWTQVAGRSTSRLGYSAVSQRGARLEAYGRREVWRVPYRTAVGSTIATPSRAPATVVSGIGGVVERACGS